MRNISQGSVSKNHAEFGKLEHITAVKRISHFVEDDVKY